MSVWPQEVSGNWNNSGTANAATGMGGIGVSALIGALDTGDFSAASWTANFGQNSFIRTPSSGFIGWPGLSGGLMRCIVI